ncbi:hypothetical protein [Pseudomonas trivialis]|uniref:Uncharacterized protein n=1 Tax=Pseudomonas trivialis TaxID=200450 RepID=A0A0H5A625_9PSED|nr:hypothetical protein [Pseudomonas trivialis]AKS05373.1 hypothetical protein AA957_04345 [Pseudomonas trivialis]
MNSTSFESRHSQYNASTLVGLAQEVENRPQVLNLTSSPKFSFKAPTAEDFDKGFTEGMEKPAPRPVLSMFAELWSKFSSR